MALLAVSIVVILVALPRIPTTTDHAGDVLDLHPE
jgi:hypothetical protein